MMKLNTMRTRLDGLVIFRGILQANIVPAFRAMLAAAGSEDFVSAAADFENQLFERGGSWTRVLLDAVLQDENICIRKAASGGAGQAAARCMDSELEFLQQLSRVTLVDLTGKPRKWILPPLTLSAWLKLVKRATACLPATTCSPLRMAA
mgnify:CR=1 FL=1